MNAGQAIDRIGVALGYKFPCGPRMEESALRFNGMIKGIKISVSDCSCNLSGLENKAIKMISEGISEDQICAYTFEFVAKTLNAIALNVREQYGELPIVWAGGVMSNSIIKKRLSSLGNVYFTEPQYSSDNAVGVALIGRNKYFAENRLQ